MNKKLIVIGGGPAGHTAAIEAASIGMNVILVEKNRMGGTCLNKGCVPTKLYLQAIKAKEQLARFGITYDTFETSNFIKQLKEIRADVTDRLNYGSIFVAERKGINVIDGEAHISGDKTIEIKRNDGLVYEEKCDYVLIATGSENKELSLGDQYILHDLDDIIMLENLPEEISIIGAGILGVEVAFILSSLGIKVHLIEKKNRILPEWDEEISSQMTYYLQEHGINVITQKEEPECKDIVFCCGRSVTQNIMDTKEDSRTRQFYIKNEWIYGAGDCVSGIKDASAAIQQGRMAVKHMMGKEINNEEIHVPHCIYTPLEAAMTGKTESQLQREGVEYEAYFYPIAFTAIGMMGGLSQGFIKVIAHKNTGKLIGFHIMSPQATEMIMACHMAVTCGMTVHEFSEIVFPHPTESEQIKEAVLGLVEKFNEI